MGRSPQAKDLADAFITVPGLHIDIVNGPPSAGINTTSTSPVEMDNANLTGSFVAPVAAKYVFRYDSLLKSTSFGASSFYVIARFRILIDGVDVVGGVSGGGPGWDAVIDRVNEWGSFAFEDSIELTAGTHTFELQWWVADQDVSGASIEQSIGIGNHVSAISLSGSGLGGIVATRLSETADQVGITTEVDVTNSSHVVNVSEGDMLVVMASVYVSPDGGARCVPQININIDGVNEDFSAVTLDTNIDFDTVKVAYLSIPFVTGGAKTVKLTALDAATTQAFTILEWKMQTFIHRGGQHEIRDADGNVITSTPRYWQLEGVVSQLQSDGGLKLTQPAAVAAPGTRISMFDGSTTPQFTITSPTFADITNLAEQEFEVPFAGIYALDMTAHVVSGNSPDVETGQSWRVVFDAAGFNGFTEQAIIAGKTSIIRQAAGANNTQYPNFIGKAVELQAGTHKVKWQALHDYGADNARTNGPFSIVGTLVTGSGAGGELTTIKGPVAAELITGVYSPGPTWTTPASLQHTMDVAEGDYVDIHFTGHQNLVSSIDTLLVMTILVDDANIRAGEAVEFNTLYRAASTADRVQLAFSTRVGPLTGGSRTFKIAAGKYGVGMSNWNLNAGIVSYTIFRGGLVPDYDKLGNLINDKPNSHQYGEGLRVVNAGGRSVVSGDFAAAGVEVDLVTDIGAAFSQTTGSATYQTVVGGDKTLSKDIYLSSPQWINVVANVKAFHATTAHESSARVDIDGTGYMLNVQDVPNAVAPNAQGTFTGAFWVYLAAGTHTIKVEVATWQPTVDWTADAGMGLFIARFKGGYTVPDNVPQLEYNSISVVNVVAAPGADSEGRVTLNDGIRRRASLPLTADLAGGVALGGLDAGTESADAWYNIFAVPSGVAGEFGVVASTALSSVGPAGYAAWKHLGWIRNDTGDIRRFFQNNGYFAYEGPQVALSGIASDISRTNLDVSAYVPVGTKFAEFDVFVVSGNIFIYTDGTEVQSVIKAVTGLAGESSWGSGSGIVPVLSGIIDYYAEQGPTDGSIRVRGWYDGELGQNTTQQAPARRSDEWNYLDLVKPTGVTASIEALWQFDGSGSDLLDRTANAHDLTLVGADMHTVIGGLKMRLFDGSTTYLNRAIDAGLQLLGALTMEALVIPSANINDSGHSNGVIIGHADPALNETSTANLLYLLSVKASTATIGQLSYDSENGAGVNSGLNAKAGLTTGQVAYVACTRSGSGSINVYVNGQLLDTGATTLPDGGATGRFTIGALGVSDVLAFFAGAIGAVRLTAEEFTASQIAEVYDRLRGRVL